MTYDVITIPCRTDNYAFVIANTTTGEAALIDAPEAAPINAALAARPGLRLTGVLLTHHHSDHIDGLPGLTGAADLTVVGSAADQSRLPPLTKAVAPGDTILICGTEVRVLAAEGHTLNHLAFHVPAAKALFTGDSLMTHGCGRLFEGTPAQMLAAMTQFAALPDDTCVYSGHDYATANLSFAKQYAPDPLALQNRLDALTTLTAAGQSTTGTTLASEKQLNPYLRVHLAEVKASVDMQGASDLDVLTEIRARKDRF